MKTKENTHAVQNLIGTKTSLQHFRMHEIFAQNFKYICVCIKAEHPRLDRLLKVHSLVYKFSYANRGFMLHNFLHFTQTLTNEKHAIKLQMRTERRIKCNKVMKNQELLSFIQFLVANFVKF